MDAVESAYRHDYGQVVASLIRITRDWDLAEDCAQEALARALERWPHEGVPDKPGAWLMTVAHRHALDRLRRDAVGAVKQRQALEEQQATGLASSSDDRLELMFTCCHPALPLENQIALTLRSLSGLSTAQVANAFLVSEATMSRRLVRAKQKIREAGIPFRVPPAGALQQRLDAVLATLYLIFNQGYSSGAELRLEAVELTRLLDQLMPDQPEVLGLLALMLMHEARMPSRGDSDGPLVPLEEQDRSRWKTPLIESGVGILDRALDLGEVGPYQVQAAIAACHATAARFEDTDWQEIASLYSVLAQMTPSPVVELNRAVAVAMADGPSTGLDMIAPLAPALANYYLLPATRADLLRRLSRYSEARAEYQQAVSLAPGEQERSYLLRRLAEIS
jgi:RNA polymerase sigma-70 factor (ECF subfamily)